MMYSAADFLPLGEQRDVHGISRPSLSYLQDAWLRLKANRRALASLYLVFGLLFFTIAGPWLWRVDPAVQDLDQISQPPGVDRAALIVPDYQSWDGAGETGPLHVVGDATSQSVRLKWDALPGAIGHRVYRNLFPVGPELAYGMPLAEFFDNTVLHHEDRLDLRPGRYFYSVVALGEDGAITDNYESLTVDVQRVTTLAEAVERGLIDDQDQLAVGDSIELQLHPLGTDYLGRDMLARLMAGARVSLFIGIVAPMLFVLFGVVFGAAAGFVGGRVDQFMMRFADFVVALPFLLFMILFKIAFGIGPGESGVMPMLVAMVVLLWPATARLVRGQILQLREAAYVQASQLLGARTNYLVLRHMLPNTLGVVLVTLTFEIPKAIFVEAFLSFIGMGVAPPTPSWGSMSNEGIATMLTTPHELIFPALFISITVLAFNLLGDGLRDALDARMRNAG
ncbi:MAG: ABC transporter permease [Gammaproteobacteria bacterium]|nr:ABC transporter permease [Gammaproteobacteria bacterium]MXY90603.1 ABC transporter permease [Gammaproteobacteria bacterium]MYE28418.1 ABC transporter permease [Gammaproteobacteria bacterium]MYG97711.1 ABC transporter permease [Gammaproteobacteria bacterium]MYI02344.1 ABC transporter permease [Gammaproteobacteria bacterium]